MEKNLGVAFSGQAFLANELGKEWGDSEAVELMEQAAEKFGLMEGSQWQSFRDMFMTAKKEDLTDTRYQQTYLMAFYAAVLGRLNDQGKLPTDRVMGAIGHSLGELAARHSAGQISLEDLMEITVQRGMIMSDAFNELTESGSPTKLCSVAGLANEVVEKIIAENFKGQNIYVSLKNSPQETVIGGVEELLKEAEVLLKEAGADKTIILNTQGAFHVPMIMGARNKFNEVLDGYEITDGGILVPSNVEGGITTDIKGSLADHLVKPVEFVENLQYLSDQGMRYLAAVAPNAGYKGLLDRHGHNIKVASLSTKEDVDRFNPNALKKVIPIATIASETYDRVAYITGIEVITPHGNMDETFKAMLEGKSAAVNVTIDDIEHLKKLSSKYVYSYKKEEIDALIGDSSQKEEIWSKLFVDDEGLRLEQKKLREKNPESVFFKETLTGKSDNYRDFDFIEDEELRNSLRDLWKTFQQEDLSANFVLNAPSRVAALIPQPYTKELKSTLPSTIAKPAGNPANVYSLVAARSVAEQAGWMDGAKDEDGNFKDPMIRWDLQYRTAAFVGTGLGGQTVNESGAIGGILGKLTSHPPKGFFGQALPNMVTSWPALTYSAKAEVKAPNAACATGLEAINMAYENILIGKLDHVIAGGAEEAAESINGIMGFGKQGATSRRNDNPQLVQRPYGKGRDGFLIGAGAGMVAVSSEKENALAKIIGTGQSVCIPDVRSGEAYSKGTVEGQSYAIEQALVNAGIKPEDVDLVVVHGTSTPVGDKIEASTYREVFGSHRPPVFAPKAAGDIGHSLGAAGAQSVALAVKILQEGVIPGIANKKDYVADPECNMPLCVENTKLEKLGEDKDAPKNVVVISFGFGGVNQVNVIQEVK